MFERRLGTLFSLTLVLLVVTGCPATPDRSPEPVRFLAPGLSAGMHYDMGHPLAGTGVAGLTSATPSPDKVHSIRVGILGLAEFREGIVEPLSQSARLVVTHRGPEPLLAAPDLFAGAQTSWFASPSSLQAWLEAGRGGGAAKLAEFQGVLVSGACAVFRVSCSEETSTGPDTAPVGSATPAGPGHPSGLMRLWVHRRPEIPGEPDAVDIALDVEAPGTFFRNAQRDANAPQHEFVLLESRPLPSGEAGFVAILPFLARGAEAIAILVEITPAPTEEGPRSRAHAIACDDWPRLLVKGRAAAPSHDPVQIDPAGINRHRRVVSARTSPVELRRSMGTLAAMTGARLACELALGGDDVLLADIGERLASIQVDLVLADLGRLLEQLALEAIVERVNKEGQASVSLQAKLIDYAGAAADPGQLLACVKGSISLAEHERRLVESNRRLLDDPAPWRQACARAWLATHTKEER